MRRPSLLLRPCSRCLLGAVLVLVTFPANAQVSLSSTDLRLASDGAGAGTLAVRLRYPTAIPDYRYPDGAPVVVYLPGGFGGGGLDAGARLAGAGFVVISFLYPGGRDGTITSDGVYDYRGDNCQRAVRDILRFAEGAATDTLGRTIDDVVPGPVLTSIVGLAPYSNGLIGLVTLDRYGAGIPRAPYQCGWENPTSGQIISGDLGSRGKDCDPLVDGDGNGVPGDDGNNPWYDPTTGYGPTTFSVDFSLLEYDSTVPARAYADPIFRCTAVSRPGAIFHDGRTNGRLDFSPTNPTCLDYDGDGVIERSEDFQLGGITTYTPACALRVYYTSEVTHALEDLAVFPSGWPSWIATPTESDVYWPLLDVTTHWDGIASRFPGLRLMTTFTKQDHVQSQGDHPHVRQVLDGAAAHSFWYRLNADASYFEAENGTLPAGYVETPANAVVPMGAMKAHAEPIGTNSDSMQVAGHAEMSDRTYLGCWWPDLSGTIRSEVVPEAEVESLAFTADRRTLVWSAAGGALCYDVLRASSLGAGAGQVLLGGGSCVEEDSPDTSATDAQVPGAGGVFYYVVKPNGIHGRYGADSAGRPRVDVDRGCED